MNEQAALAPTPKNNSGVGMNHTSTWQLTWKSFSEHPDIDQGRGFTLNFMQKFDREAITDEKLANINADFEALAKSRAGL